MKLMVPLSISQIEAANRLHQRLPQWQITDHALHALQVCFPDFGSEATLLKVVAVNQLYGTNVYAVIRMAQHVVDVMLDLKNIEDVELVEELATLTGRKHLSFASKFAHFFIDMERFPIYDSFAVKMVAYHLGRQGKVTNTAHPYKAFVENINRLKERAHLSCTSKEIDRYLWLAGLYQEWRTAAKPEINREIEELFESLFINSLPISPLSEMLPTEFAHLERKKPRAKKDKKE